MKVILITGASSGMGYYTAKQLAEQGYRVYGAARHLEKMDPLKRYGVIPLSLDVTNDQSRTTAIDTILQNEQQIDVLINSAGYGSYGPIETVSITEAEQQFNVNVFGLVELTKLVIPQMRKQRSGRIVNLSSVAGRITTYMGGWYHASKYALEALSNSMRMELSKFGIKVTIIEPGAIKTNWGIIAANHLANTTKGTPYAEEGQTVADGMQHNFTNGKWFPTPEKAANTIVKAATVNHPKPRYLIGASAYAGIIGNRILPTRMFDHIIKRIFK